jgi:uncharacterized protein (DUF58 family)
VTVVRRLVVAAGVVLSAAGVVAVTAPAAVPAFDLATYLVAATGVTAFVVGAADAYGRFDAGADRLVLPARETPPAVAVPGDDFARLLRDADWDGDDLRHRLHETAVAVLSKHAGWSPSTAQERLDDGSWTDDPEAAALFADGPVSARDHVRSLVSGEPPVRKRARHAADALYELATGDEPGGDQASPEPPTTDDAFPNWPTDGESVVRRTTRWRGARALALLAVAAGALLSRPGLLLAASVAVAYVTYDRVAQPPPVTIDAHRTVGDTDPDLGDEVTVEVRLRNAGDRLLPDLRFVDGVPPGLCVADGSPRCTTALRPGKTASFSYTVTATRGGHEFDAAFLLARDYLGASERATRVEMSGDCSLTCVPPLPTTAAAPVRDAVTRVVGRGAATPAPGGVEFHALREYRRGDPVARIDWGRLAKTGDLATVEVREPRTASVVVAIDARAAAYVAPEPGGPPAVERAVTGARAVTAGLLDDGHRVGLAALSPRDCWVAPGAGFAHRTRLADRLATSPAFARDQPPERSPVALADRLRRRLPDDAQVLVLTSLTDDDAVTLLRRLDAHGTPVAVVSPDATATDGSAHRLARVERRLRAADLRRAGIPVHDWPWNVPFERAAAGWWR